MEDACVVVQAR